MNNYICHRLRILRQTHHLTQEDISQYLNVSRSCYCQYELGKRCPGINVLNELSRLYNVPIGEMIKSEEIAVELQGSTLSLYPNLSEEEKLLVDYIVQFLYYKSTL